MQFAQFAKCRPPKLLGEPGLDGFREGVDGHKSSRLLGQRDLDGFNIVQGVSIKSVVTRGGLSGRGFATGVKLIQLSLREPLTRGANELKLRSAPGEAVHLIGDAETIAHVLRMHLADVSRSHRAGHDAREFTVLRDFDFHL